MLFQHWGHTLALQYSSRPSFPPETQLTHSPSPSVHPLAPLDSNSSSPSSPFLSPTHPPSLPSLHSFAPLQNRQQPSNQPVGAATGRSWGDDQSSSFPSTSTSPSTGLSSTSQQHYQDELLLNLRLNRYWSRSARPAIDILSPHPSIDLDLELPEVCICMWRGLQLLQFITEPANGKCLNRVLSDAVAWPRVH